MDAPGLADEPTDFDDEDIPSSDHDLIVLGDFRCIDMQGRITDLDGEVPGGDKGPRDNLLRWFRDPEECAVYLAALNEAIDCVPDKTFLYVNRGIAYQARREDALAMADFDQAIELDPTKADAYVARGWLNVSMRRYDEAVDDFTNGLRLGDDEPIPFIYCGGRLVRAMVGGDDLHMVSVTPIGYVARYLHLKFIVSMDRERDGKMWLHASVSRNDKRMPSYAELMDLKRLCVGADRTALQVFPPAEKHVDIAGKLGLQVLHLWSCLDEDVTPDFTRGTNLI